MTGSEQEFSMTVKQLIQERKKFIRLLKNQMRVIDTNQEKSERLLMRLLARKLKVPEDTDLKILSDQAQAISIALTAYIRLLAGGYPD